MRKLDVDQKQSVLIIDDNQQDVNSLKKLLRKEYRIRSANTVEKAFKAIGTRNPPDLVLLNALMTGMDGGELCKKLRSTPKTWNIPVILITTEFSEDEESRLFKMGAADYLLKPFNPLTVAARVRTHAEIKKYRECLEVSYYRDGLTALPNNRRFEEYYDSVWSFAVRESLPLSLIKVSIADFDWYVDNYGQQAMDDCLMAIAKNLSHAARRKTDMLARTGREEFTCVLPNTRIDGAIVLAEAFRASVSSLGILGSSNDTDVSIGINQGVATTIPTNDMLSKKLLEAAEEALKKSISEGSNQINCKSI